MSKHKFGGNSTGIALAGGFAILALLVGAAFVACDKDDDGGGDTPPSVPSELVGKWKHSQQISVTFEITSDGKLKSVIEYSISVSNRKVTASMVTGPATFNYQISDDGNELTVSDVVGWGTIIANGKYDKQ
jgi:hypothetical protein